MDFYTTIQWLLYFYIYCILGWCFETIYVSIMEKHFVNRGFMHGPYLPIYGSGAIIILLATLPVQDNLLLIYIFGALAATALELVTGMAMESIFKVRYWDYSNQKLNFHGHICLSSTIAWGFLSILMVKVLHKPVADIVMGLNSAPVTVFTLALTLLIAADFSVSCKTAFDLRQLLIKLEEEAEKTRTELRLLRKRVDVVTAVKREDLEQLLQSCKFKVEDSIHEQLDELRLLQKRMEVVQAVCRDEFENLAENNRKLLLEQFSGLLEKIEDGSEELRERFEKLEQNLRSFTPTAAVRELLSSLGSFRQQKRQRDEAMQLQLTRDKISLLKRNPSAKSPKYESYFEKLRRDSNK